MVRCGGARSIWYSGRLDRPGEQPFTFRVSGREGRVKKGAQIPVNTQDHLSKLDCRCAAISSRRGSTIKSDHEVRQESGPHLCRQLRGFDTCTSANNANDSVQCDSENTRWLLLCSLY